MYPHKLNLPNKWLSTDLQEQLLKEKWDTALKRDVVSIPDRSGGSKGNIQGLDTNSSSSNGSDYDDSGVSYTLVAIIRHHGASATAGHYTAVCRHGDDMVSKYVILELNYYIIPILLILERMMS